MRACWHPELHRGSACVCPVCSVEGLETKESGGLIPALEDHPFQQSGPHLLPSGSIACLPSPFNVRWGGSRGHAKKQTERHPN